jgi:hypothetical protein
VDWFRFWLQGYKDPAAAKAEQYRRWEKLCDSVLRWHETLASFTISRVYVRSHLYLHEFGEGESIDQQAVAPN